MYQIEIIQKKVLTVRKISALWGLKIKGLLVGLHKCENLAYRNVYCGIYVYFLDQKHKYIE